jgi:NAD(P)-dependent dehydrogenase (short-subunit alcohol dehydrogenase family)
MRDTRGAFGGAAEVSSVCLTWIELDVADDASVEQGIARALDVAGGHIDVVINNAGFAGIGVTEAFSIEQFRAMYETNVLGVVRVNRAVLPSMRERKSGLLIHVSSVAGRTTLPYMAAYCSSKYALESISEAYRMELAPFGVDCVVVEPGAFSTPVFSNMYSPADSARVSEYGSADHSQSIQHAFDQMVSHPSAPPVSMVAETFQRLIETPVGQRPFRTFVGGGPNILEAYNAAAEQIRAGAAELFGVGHLLTPTIAKGAGE